jgi:hypothetical protein
MPQNRYAVISALPVLSTVFAQQEMTHRFESNHSVCRIVNDERRAVCPNSKRELRMSDINNTRGKATRPKAWHEPGLRMKCGSFQASRQHGDFGKPR